VSLWLYENVNTRIEGIITGFDEYMNLVLDDAYEVWLSFEPINIRVPLKVYSSHWNWEA
jgi:small nuclear ribonucleoprotein (snRNP)-like protein